MELLEKIKTEYMLIELPATPVNKEEVAAVIDVYLDDLDESEITVRSAMMENDFDLFIQSIKNLVMSCFGYEGIDLEFFDEDDKILEQHEELAGSFKCLFTAMKDSLADDNYLDIYRLVVYTGSKYTSNFEYLEDVRDRLRYAYDGGVTYIGYNHVNDSNEFICFFEDLKGLLLKVWKNLKICDII